MPWTDPMDEHARHMALYALLSAEKMLSAVPAPLARELVQAALIALGEECFQHPIDIH